jgi:hypothetical protein
MSLEMLPIPIKMMINEYNNKNFLNNLDLNQITIDMNENLSNYYLAKIGRLQKSCPIVCLE